MEKHMMLPEMMRDIRREAADALQMNSILADSKEVDRQLLTHLERLTMQFTREKHITTSERHVIIQTIFDGMRRVGLLTPLLEDPSVTEVMVNGPKHIYAERDGVVSRQNLQFDTENELVELIMQMAAKVNRTINESEPIVDARLPDGSRVNAVLKPIALNGPLLTIRKFPETPMTLERLITLHALTPQIALYLELLVKARYNIFVCGGTGSGKTTLLNALSGKIPSEERIVTIEDSAELQLCTVDNLARLETRMMNSEGKGEIRIKQLIRTALRMRPERIIVGEVRGDEALDMLQAMNTGHDGSMSTGHANSSFDMLSRLETMVLMAAPLPLEAIRKQIASALDIIIFLSRLRDRTRRIIEISEVCGLENGEIVLNPLFQFQEEGMSESGFIIGELAATGSELKATDKAKQRAIQIPACYVKGEKTVCS